MDHIGLVKRNRELKKAGKVQEATVYPNGGLLPSEPVTKRGKRRHAPANK